MGRKRQTGASSGLEGAGQNSNVNFFETVQRVTEAFLTRRARRKRLHKEKQEKKHPVIDWIEAFVWAAGMVLLANQYALQAYQIPSGSMIDTLEIGDHIFVNKLVYGPEILPGVGKLPSIWKPSRNDVIIFDNPAYISNGAVFDIAQRVIYMLTISIVDIDRDENGRPKAHFLIKRAAGLGGDRFINKDGEMYVKFAGETRYVAERAYNEQRGWNHHISRDLRPEDYKPLKAAAKANAYSYIGVEPPVELFTASEQNRWPRFVNDITFDTTWLSVLRGAYPHDGRYAVRYARRAAGWYIPEGRVLPLGDNRDNSHDGRYFGAVKETKVLGKGWLKYWPPRRMGAIG